ncbi:transcription factor IIIC subunit delta N-term-domain-containing protein [Geranomyces variabilis]|nr:transcription factor IIIC subunit delta N-term-domain-containing protein [Geranomyces variabilis]
MASAAASVLRLTTRPLLPDSLSWSADNQIAVVTLLALHIVTPQQRYSTDQPLRTLISSRALRGDSAIVSELGRTEREGIHAVEVFKDGFFRSVWSPSGCSPQRGCLLATLGTLHSVIIWAPVADPATSPWELLCDVSGTLIKGRLGRRKAESLSAQEIARLSFVSIAWSPLCGAAKEGGTSFITLGAKDGSVAILEYNTENQSVRPVAECPAVADAWVSNLSWSSWSTPVANRSSAYLAVAWSDGSVCVYSVALTHGEDPVFEVQRCAELFAADRRLVPVLNFVQPSLDKHEPRLALTKGKRLVVWFGPTVEVPGDSIAALDLPAPIATIAGITWGLDTEELRLYSQSGSLFEISVTPATASSPPGLALVEDSTADLWREVQQVPPEESAGADGDAANEGAGEDDETPAAGGGAGPQLRIHGAAMSASSMYDAVLYHMSSITDMYISPKQETSLLLLRPTFSYSGDEFESAVRTRFERHLRDSYLFLKMSSAYLLWDLLQYCLVDLSLWPGPEQSFTARFVKLLEDFYMETSANGSANTSDISGEDARANYRKALFCNSSVNGLRLTTALTSALVAVAAANSSAGTDSTSLRAWAASVRKRNRAVLEEHYLAHTLQAVDARLTSGEEIADVDLKAVALMSDRVLTLRSISTRPDAPKPSALVNDAVAALRGIHAGLATRGVPPTYIASFDEMIAQMAETTDQKSSSAPLLPARETCPACNAPVPLASLSSGVCGNGHVWNRCIATLACLGVVGVRKCRGCGARTSAASQSERGWIAGAVDQCVYCAGRFDQVY